VGRADGVGPEQPPRAMPRSNKKQDRYAYAAANHPRVNGETFTAGATFREMSEAHPELWEKPSDLMRVAVLYLKNSNV
jgi:hypothetical protein